MLLKPITLLGEAIPKFSKNQTHKAVKGSEFYAETSSVYGLIQQNQKQLENCQARIMTIAEGGVSDGMHNIPLPDATEFSAKENQIIAECKKVLRLAKPSIQNEKQKLELYLQAPASDDVFSLSEKENEEQLHREAERMADQRLRWNWKQIGLSLSLWWYGTVSALLAYLHENLTQTQEEKLKLEIFYESLLQNRYQGIAPIKKWYDIRLLLNGLLVVLFCSEIGANFQAFQSLGGSMNIIAIGLGCLVALFLAIAAKELGFALRRYAFGSWKVQLFLWSTFLLCVLISVFRFLNGGLILANFIYGSINFIIAFFTSWFAWKHAGNADYFLARQKKRKAAYRVASLENQIEVVKEDFRKHREEAIWDARQSSVHVQTARLEYRQRREQTYQQLLGELEAHDHQIKEQCEVMKNEAITSYRQLNEKARKQKRTSFSNVVATGKICCTFRAIL